MAPKTEPITTGVTDAVNENGRVAVIQVLIILGRCCPVLALSVPMNAPYLSQLNLSSANRKGHEGSAERLRPESLALIIVNTIHPADAYWERREGLVETKSSAVGQFDHVGIAVHSIERARVFFESVLGASFRFERIDRGGTFRFSVFDLSGFTIELLEPIAQNSFLTKFLEKRGEGVHHITLQTPRLKEKIELLEGKGIRVVDKHLDDPGFRDAFISPKSACGVLFQLSETSPPLDNPPYWEPGSD